MGLLKTMTMGIIFLFFGCFLGIILYVILGGETTEPKWENWMYFPCYFIPFCALIGGMIIGHKIDNVNE